MPSVLEEPIQTRGELEQKCTFLDLERERENWLLGWARWPWSGSKGCQEQSLASPKSLAQRVEAMGVCVHEKFHS